MKGGDTNEASYNFRAGAVVVATARVTFAQHAAVSASSSSVPLFIAPAGSRVVNANVDIINPRLPASGATLQVGVSGNTAMIIAEASCETVRRLSHSPTTSAVLSALSIPFAVDTTIEMKVSVSGTGTGTAGEYFVWVQLAANTSVVP